LTSLDIAEVRLGCDSVSTYVYPILSSPAVLLTSLRTSFSTEDMRGSDWLKLLESQRDSLETLEIVYGDYPVPPGNKCHDVFMASLQKLHRLRRLNNAVFALNSSNLRDISAALPHLELIRCLHHRPLTTTFMEDLYDLPKGVVTAQIAYASPVTTMTPSDEDRLVEVFQGFAISRLRHPDESRGFRLCILTPEAVKAHEKGLTEQLAQPPRAPAWVSRCRVLMQAQLHGRLVWGWPPERSPRWRDRK
jgi:hypothetical protein